MVMAKKISFPSNEERERKLNLVKEEENINSNGEVVDKLFDVYFDHHKYKGMEAEFEKAKRLTADFHDFVFHLLNVADSKAAEATKGKDAIINELTTELNTRNEKIAELSSKIEKDKEKLEEKDALIEKFVKNGYKLPSEDTQIANENDNAVIQNDKPDAEAIE